MKPKYQYEPNQLLLPYQRTWLDDKSQLKIAEKSRRTGLTWAEAAGAALTASAQKGAGGSDHFYIGSNKEMAVEFIEACADWAKSFHLVADSIQEEVFKDEDKDILTFTIHFASGFKIQALSSNPKNTRGRQGNVTIDEAALHDQLGEVIKAANALTMWGNRVALISTHNGVENLFNELITDSRAGKKDYSVHRITLDDACEQGLYKRICQVSGKTWSQDAEDQWKAALLKNTATPEDAQEEYYCVPKQGGGAYINRLLIESRMIDAPVIRYAGTSDFNAWPEHIRMPEIDDWCKEYLLPQLAKLPAEQWHAFGEDFARSGDLTVIAPITVEQNLKRTVPFIVELKNLPFKNQEQILVYIADRLPRLIGGKLDARGNGQYLAEQAKYKYGAQRIEEVMLSQSWYLSNMPKLKAAFEDDMIRIPRDADILSDLRAIQVINGIPKIPDGKTDEAKQRHGDAAIAIALAYVASQMDIAEYAYQSVKPTDYKDDSDINLGFRGRDLL